jgi:hypothetical protein
VGANPNARSQSGVTPLMLAVNSFEIASLLIAAGADAKISALVGGTALSRAAEYPSSNDVVDYIAKRIRRQDAVLLLDWTIALAPLQLPICELIHVRLCSLVDVDIYLELADYSIDFQDAKTGVGVQNGRRCYNDRLCVLGDIYCTGEGQDHSRRHGFISTLCEAAQYGCVQLRCAVSASRQ